MGAIYLCPSISNGGCFWEGRDVEILEHFRFSHKKLLANVNKVRIDIRRDCKENILMALCNEIYLVQTQVEVCEQKLRIRLRYLGSEEKASCFRYDVQVSAEEKAFTSLVNEKCNVVYKCGEFFEVDLQLIKLSSGKTSTDFLDCSFYIKKLNQDESTVDKLNSENEENEETVSDVQNNDDNNIDVEKSENEDTVSSAEEKKIDFENVVLKRTKSDSRIYKTHPFRNSVTNLKRFFSFINNDEKDDISSAESDIASVFEKADAEAEIQCANCKLDMLPPIYMCPEGHSVCIKCKTKNCPICNNPITDLRNVDLEEISKKVKHTCQYKKFGCTFKCPYDEIRIHETNCKYCSYHCYLCPTEGKFTDMRSHFKLFHPSEKMVCELENEFPRNTSFVIMNSECGVFHCNSYLRGSGIVWVVNYCGPKRHWYSCELKLKGKKNEISRFLKRNGNSYQLELPLNYLKTNRVKDKHAFLKITSY